MKILILIVEDEDILSRVLKDKFESDGFQVELVTEGNIVIDAIKKFSPDFILLDILLPRKNGLDILKELKSDPKLKKIPVMIISNLFDSKSMKDAKDLGAIEYMVKTEHPINEVVWKVKNYFSTSKN